MSTLFTSLYERVMRWSEHPHAVFYLGGLSFAESSFFPIPPDVMLAPMSVAAPKRALWFALVTTVASVLGGVFGYFIGWFAFDALEPWLQSSHYWEKYLTARGWFEEWGIWVVFIAGFSPIPYKLFTVTAGVLSLALVPFVIASFIGRGGRFFLVAALLSWFGPKVEPAIKKHVEWIGWGTVLAAAAIFAWYTLTH